jgi:hypothetical protein
MRGANFFIFYIFALYSNYQQTCSKLPTNMKLTKIHILDIIHCSDVYLYAISDETSSPSSGKKPTLLSPIEREQLYRLGSVA